MPKYLILSILLFPTWLIGQQESIHDRQCHHEVRLMGNHINTDDPDLASFQYAGKLYYSSFFLDNKIGKKVSRVFTTNKSQPPVLFEKNPNQRDVHMAYPAIPIMGTRFYFTLFEENVNKIIESEIWYREKDYEGKWGIAKKLPQLIGVKGHVATQPSTGIFRETRKEVLFFVSDRPGGNGKLDIWASEIERDGTFGEPYNLPFNTAEDDVSPYFDIETQTLFFSTKGLFSYGGFDIYRTQRNNDGTWKQTENLLRPINSNFDDVFFTYHGSTNESYFSSDRPNETCPDSDPQCRDYDIHQAKLKTKLEVFVYDDKNSAKLSGCNIELADLQTGKIIETYLNLPDNYASLGLERGRNYQLIVSKQGYYPMFGGINTERQDPFQPIFRQLFMIKMGAGSVKN